jgi:hypothetical protein
MTITLRAGSTVMFTGDSITDSSLGFGYPQWIEGEWGFRHPGRPRRTRGGVATPGRLASA